MNSYTDQTNMSRLIRHNCQQRSVLPVHILSAIASRRTALHRANAMITQVGFHDMPSVVWRQGRATQLVNPLSTFSLLAACRSRSGLAWYDPDPAAIRGILAGQRRLAGSLAAPGRRSSRRPGLAGAQAPRSPRRPSPTLVWTPGRASVRWGGRNGVPPRQPSQHPSPVRYPAGHGVRDPAGHGVRRRASPPRLPGPSPPRAARPPCWLIPLWAPPRLLHQPYTAPHSPRRAVITDPFMCGLAALQVYCAISLSRYPRSKCSDRKRGLE